jgi:SET domain-containing protein
MKTNKNSLNISITKPNQVLIIMRGIPGSVEVRESTVHGRGVFANSKLLKNTVFEIPILPIVKKTVPDDLLIYSFPFDNIKCCFCLGFITLVNHSNIPNLKVLELDKIKLIKKFIIINDIEIGEELFLNYGHNNF